MVKTFFDELTRIIDTEDKGTFDIDLAYTTTGDGADNIQVSLQFYSYRDTRLVYYADGIPYFMCHFTTEDDLIEAFKDISSYDELFEVFISSALYVWVYDLERKIPENAIDIEADRLFIYL